MWDELENALAWYATAPKRWMQSAKQDLSAAAEWIWVVLQGDFADEQSTAQVITGTVISMIPFVDQICDVRDVVANSKKINEDSSNKWAWVALVLTLIGLFPTLGSLFKGCFKVLFAYGRKAMFSAGKVALDADIWKASKPFVEAGIKKLNDFMARPEVRKALGKLKVDNPYKYLADKLREVTGSLSVAKLTQAFDSAIGALNKLLELVTKWGTAAMQSKAGALLQSVKRVRDQANSKLAEVLAPVQNWLDKLAKRLELEHSMTHRATTNITNPHSMTRLSLDAEIEAIKKAPPEWVKVRKRPLHKAAENAPAVPPGHFDIGQTNPPPGAKDAFKTFARDVRPDRLPPGTVIYRVVDPNSADNSICWVTEEVFKSLHSKAEWRDRLAVWGSWNRNGEYTRYKVPPGDGLAVWRGKAASQQLKDRAGNVVKADATGSSYWLDGGAEQLVVSPRDLNRAHIEKRKFTYWDDGPTEIEVSLVGVPTLTNWRDWK